MDWYYWVAFIVFFIIFIVLIINAYYWYQIAFQNDTSDIADTCAVSSGTASTLFYVHIFIIVILLIMFFIALFYSFGADEVTVVPVPTAVPVPVAVPVVPRPQGIMLQTQTPDGVVRTNLQHVGNENGEPVFSASTPTITREIMTPSRQQSRYLQPGLYDMQAPRYDNQSARYGTPSPTVVNFNTGPSGTMSPLTQ